MKLKYQIDSDHPFKNTWNVHSMYEQRFVFWRCMPMTTTLAAILFPDIIIYGFNFNVIEAK